jgi:hypothetical protein
LDGCFQLLPKHAAYEKSFDETQLKEDRTAIIATGFTVQQGSVLPFHRFKQSIRSPDQLNVTLDMLLQIHGCPKNGGIIQVGSVFPTSPGQYANDLALRPFLQNNAGQGHLQATHLSRTDGGRKSDTLFLTPSASLQVLIQ